MVKSTKYTALYRAAHRRGLLLIKKRDSLDNRLGTGYQLVNRYTGEVIKGRTYNLTSEEVIDFLNGYK